jgi:hypothetical protein
MASLTVSVAGALSMGGGAFVATSSELEVRRLEESKRAFLGGATPEGPLRPPAAGGGAGGGLPWGTGR